MLQLKCNDRVVVVGGDAVVEEFEDAVVQYNTATSGWDKDGNFWVIRELPDITEYQPLEES